jgi:2-methylisocitrate lyase-like PEP mutase family enzyme
MSEMVESARRIVSAVSVPVIADADTGYGNALNVMRTVGEYEAAGVAAIHIEDQVTPKRCGHMNDKKVVSIAEAVDKVRAAVAAKTDPEFMIIARTDARAVDGLDAAIDRARRFLDAGADCLFIEALTEEDEIATVAQTFTDVPLLFNWAEGGKTPPLELDRIHKLGFRIVIYPLSTIMEASRALQDVLTRIRDDGSPARTINELPSFDDFTSLVGMREIEELAERFGDG